MQSSGLSFHHPVAFWFGCLLIVAGVFSHAPMFLMGQHTHWQMVGMPMDGWMLAGMAAIPIGLIFAAYGLMPRLALMQQALHGDSRHLHFHVADGVPLNIEHWKLVSVLVIALAVDVMKPATLGFVMPGMSAEYEITKPTASLLALVALTGTTVGSVLWGRVADMFGRRAAILLGALMFMGTAICGAMPSFGWNLAMCFLMGASAGGLLPITFTLMAETVPAAHRGWLLVALGGIGTSAGYLLAAGAAATLEPMFSWRVLWLLGLPTGAIILVLYRFIPESPRFLSNAGLGHQARAVLRKFSGRAADAVEVDDAEHPGAPKIDDQHPVTGMRQLLRGRHAPITWGLVMCGVAWGLANFGFLLWLPVNLTELGVDPKAASALLAQVRDLRASRDRGGDLAVPPLEQLPLAGGVHRPHHALAARVLRDGRAADPFRSADRRRHRLIADQHKRRHRHADPVCRGDLSGAPARHRLRRYRGELQVRWHRRRGARCARLFRPFLLVGAADRRADGGVGRDAAAQWHRDARAPVGRHPGRPVRLMAKAHEARAFVVCGGAMNDLE